MCPTLFVHDALMIIDSTCSSENVITQIK